MTDSCKLFRRVLGAAAIALVTVIAVPGKGFAETVPITDRSAVGELNFWNSIKESTDPADLKRYLDEFPDGMFIDPAVARYEQLTGQKLGLRSVETTSASTADASTDTQINPEPPPKPAVKAASKKKAMAKKTANKAVSTNKSKKKVTSKKSAKKAVSKKKTENKKKASTKKVNCSAGQSALACGRTGGGGGGTPGGGSTGGGGWN